MRERGLTRARLAGLIAGPALFAVVLLLPKPPGMSEAANRVAALAAWMATWWLSTPVPLQATALLPLIVIPLIGVAPFDRAAVPYANSVIFLFLGGFFLAAAMERWGLHRRVAYAILALVGTEAKRVVLAFMIATGFVSMWISNTATTVMMMPMAVAVLALAGPGDGGIGGRRDGEDGDFGTALVLGVAYAASIGGISTLIGTPPNAIFAGAVKQLLHREVGFGAWMIVALPLAVLLLAVCWLVLTRVCFRVSGRIEGLAEQVGSERAALGRLAGEERFTLVVFLVAVAGWILRDPKTIGRLTIPGIATYAPPVTDSMIAIAAALVLFIVPVSWRRPAFALDWPTAQRAPWGMLLLFGGGLSLADAFQTSGLSQWIGELLGGMAGQPRALVVGVVATVFVMLSDLASNAAVAAMAMPLMAGIAPAVGQDPVTLMSVAALSSSMSFLLPVSTPPNTVAFSTGYVTAGRMARAGVVLNLIAILSITVVGTWVL